MHPLTGLLLSAGLITATPVAHRATTSSSSFSPSTPPTAHVLNGTYTGRLDPTYNHDLFLGMPFAQPPVGPFRFAVPQPLNTTWTAPRNATSFSKMCIGYGSDTWVLGNYVSEDCLTVNVVRPSGVAEGAELPVAVWIHGGGYMYGSSADPRYNLSYVVAKSEAMGSPIVAASFNYRLQNWGFMFSEALREEGSTNVAYRDQRLALQWIQENIGAFGGDKKKVTVFGESAGSMSIATQNVAYGGRDDSLYRAAIMESGSALPTFRVHKTTDDWAPYWAALLNETNCDTFGNGTAGNKAALACLRAIPETMLSNIFNSSFASIPGITSSIDGDFLTESATLAIKKGAFVKVPILMGTNTDEGTAFGTTGINTDDEFITYLESTGLTLDMAQGVLARYPDDPEQGIPASYPGRPEGVWGSQFKRVSAYRGDYFMGAPRRLTVQKATEAGLNVYSYDFDVVNAGLPAIIGSTHFQEIPYVFNNTVSAGFVNAVSSDPLAGKGPEYFELVDVMSRSWISFIVSLDPNNNGLNGTHWPKYVLENPQNIVFDVNVTNVAYVRNDTYRAEGMQYIIDSIYES